MLTMPADCIAFRDTNFFSSLICDYLDEKPELKSLYNRFPKIENFKSQIEEKQKAFNSESRTTLVSVLTKQYQHIEASKKTHSNIDALKQENTYTITTGHQLNLFTGPLYFLYKIVSTINLCKELKAKYPDNNFVPIYWMATEDHDFDEINYFNFNGKKVQWIKGSSGAVGELDLGGLENVYEAFSKVLGNSEQASELKTLFKNAYLKHKNLADATRFLANTLFSDQGLVILDANDSELKRLFIPFIKDELTNQTASTIISKTNQQILKKSNQYKIQVNPRTINFFYLKDGLRERIILENDLFKVVNSNISWTKSEILKHLIEAPECFSPNVILRPLYQEVILPNLCYIGGGGELAYWLQLKDYFDTVNVTFPIVLLRNSVLVKTGKQSEKQQKLNVSNSELFLNQNDLINKKVKELSAINIDFTSQKKHIETQFKDLGKLAEQTDKSFIGAVDAQERKQIKGLEHLEKRLLKAQKRKLKDHTERIINLQNELFPNQSLQERQLNFSQLYLLYGKDLIPALIKTLMPLQAEFIVLKL